MFGPVFRLVSVRACDNVTFAVLLAESLQRFKIADVGRQFSTCHDFLFGSTLAKLNKMRQTSGRVTDAAFNVLLEGGDELDDNALDHHRT